MCPTLYLKQLKRFSVLTAFFILYNIFACQFLDIKLYLNFHIKNKIIFPLLNYSTKEKVTSTFLLPNTVASSDTSSIVPNRVYPLYALLNVS